MRCRGIRGATTVQSNTREELLSATRELLTALVEANQVQMEDIACVIFSTTRDLNSEFPAVAARELGWSQVAFLCGHEIDVPGSLRRCIRVLLLVNTEKKAENLIPVYIRGAEVLRPDAVQASRGKRRG